MQPSTRQREPETGAEDSAADDAALLICFSLERHQASRRLWYDVGIAFARTGQTYGDDRMVEVGHVILDRMAQLFPLPSTYAQVAADELAADDAKPNRRINRKLRGVA